MTFRACSTRSRRVTSFDEGALWNRSWNSSGVSVSSKKRFASKWTLQQIMARVQGPPCSSTRQYSKLTSPPSLGQRIWISSKGGRVGVSVMGIVCGETRAVTLPGSATGAFKGKPRRAGPNVRSWVSGSFPVLSTQGRSLLEAFRDPGVCPGNTRRKRQGPPIRGRSSSPGWSFPSPLPWPFWLPL